MYYIICGKYEKIENSKILYILEKALVLFIICSQCGSENEKTFKKRRINWDINIEIYYFRDNNDWRKH